jgi:hypothetical protein
LAEAEWRHCWYRLGSAEEKFDKWYYHDEGEHVEEYGQGVEEKVQTNVAGVVPEVAEDSPDVLHGSG